MIAQPRYQTYMKNNLGKATVLSAFVSPCKPFPQGLGINATAQYVPGSGADKVTHYVFNICSTWSIPGILIIEGDNRDITPARDWAKSIVGTEWLSRDFGNPGNLLGVFTQREFEQWLDCCISEGKPITQAPKQRFTDLLFQADLFGES